MIYLFFLISSFLILFPGLKINPVPDKYQPAEYTVNFTDNKFTIDGILNEEGWKNCLSTAIFVRHESGQAPKFNTQVQILWDDRNIYFAFTIFDKNIWATKTNHDDRLWDEEVIEIFLDPDGDGRNYFELQVNALGAVTDILMDKEYGNGGQADFSWNAESLKKGISISGSINDAKEDSLWVCELTLPFKDLQIPNEKKAFKPQTGDVWRINMCRIETDRFGDKNSEFTCWSQTDTRGFHAPDKFGRIIFSQN